MPATTKPDLYAQHLALARAHRQVSASELAAISGVDADRINKIQSTPGKQGKPRSNELERLATALAVPLAWLAAADVATARQHAPGWVDSIARSVPPPPSEGPQIRGVGVMQQRPCAPPRPADAAQRNEDRYLAWLEQVESAWRDYLTLGKDARRDPEMRRLSTQAAEAKPALRFYRDHLLRRPAVELFSPAWLCALAQALGVVEKSPHNAGKAPSLCTPAQAQDVPETPGASFVRAQQQIMQQRLARMMAERDAMFRPTAPTSVSAKPAAPAAPVRSIADALVGLDPVDALADPFNAVFYVALLQGPRLADSLCTKLQRLRDRHLIAGDDWELTHAQIRALHGLRLATDEPMPLWKAIQTHRHFRAASLIDERTFDRWLAATGIAGATILRQHRGRIMPTEKLRTTYVRTGVDGDALEPDIQRLVDRGHAQWRGQWSAFVLLHDEHDLAEVQAQARATPATA